MTHYTEKYDPTEGIVISSVAGVLADRTTGLSLKLLSDRLPQVTYLMKTPALPRVDVGERVRIFMDRTFSDTLVQVGALEILAEDGTAKSVWLRDASEQYRD